MVFECDSSSPPAQRLLLQPHAPKRQPFGDQARRSGVPASTIKHYIREGLLPAPRKEDEPKHGVLRHVESIEPYLQALTALVRTELEMFRAGVMPRSGDDLVKLTRAAATLSESLILVLRRKLLLPTLQEIMENEENQ